MNLNMYLKSKGCNSVSELVEASNIKERTLRNWYNSGDEKRWIIDAMIEKFVREKVDN